MELETPPSLLGQGAEARLFACAFLGAPCVLKERFAKAYRQPALDARITRERCAAEARCLARCRRAGVDAPRVLHVDAGRARLFLERVDGPTVKQWLALGPQAAAAAAVVAAAPAASVPGESAAAALAPAAGAAGGPEPFAWCLPVAAAVGEAVARIHRAGLVHGDLTTSNMILRGGFAHCGAGTSAAVGAGASTPASAGAGSGLGTSPSAHPSPASPPATPCLCLLDFGLGGQNASAEEKGVDLYVLERALLAAHADLAVPFFARCREVYFATLAAPAAEAEAGALADARGGVAQKRVAAGSSAADAAAVRLRFEQVRARGRKRLAFG